MSISIENHPQVHSVDPKFRQLIELELVAVLGSAQFLASGRSCDFLRYIVQSTLDGRLDLLKERTIGVAVLGRKASYDTGADAAVRVRAVDVRRRLTAYYSRCGSRTEWRIALRPGSYIPRWVWESEQCAVLTYVPGRLSALVIEGASADIIRDAARRLSADGPVGGTFDRLAASSTPARASIFFAPFDDPRLPGRASRRPA